MEHVPDLDHADPVAVKDRLWPLLKVIHQTLDGAILQARSFFADSTPDPWVFSPLVRYHFKERLRPTAGPKLLPDGAEFMLLPNNGLKFSYQRTEIRAWKADEDGEPPAARNSHSMAEFYHQPSINLLDVFGEKLPLKLVVIWDVDIGFAFAGLKLVCPRRVLKVWESGESHWQIPVPDPVQEITAAGAFSEPVGDIEALQPKKQAETGTK